MAAPPPPPAAAAAAVAHVMPRSMVAEYGRTYAFAGREVCSKCGAPHHTADACCRFYCSSCKAYGHRTGRCASACRICGWCHPSSMCKTPVCPTCRLWGKSL
jgi:hypothetical protein